MSDRRAPTRPGWVGALVYLATRFGMFLAGWLPAKMWYWGARRSADLWFLLSRRMRENIVENMAQVTGRPASDPAVRRLARHSLQHYALYMADFLHFPHLTRENIDRQVTMTGLQHVDEALAKGKGLIVASMHFGNWDMVGAALAQRAPVVAVAEVLWPPRLNGLVQRQRERHGVHIVPWSPDSGGGFLRDLIRALRQNQVLALVVDRPVRRGGVPVTFFGRQTMVPSGAGALAVRTGTPIVVGYTRRRADNTYEGFGFPPIWAEKTGDTDRDVQVTTQRIFDRLEEIIRQWPEQWFMFRRMWQPVDSAALPTRRRGSSHPAEDAAEMFRSLVAGPPVPQPALSDDPAPLRGEG